ncbi:MAG: DUF3336 domain-containing protein [Pseudomonadota bacterium]
MPDMKKRKPIRKADKRSAKPANYAEWADAALDRDAKSGLDKWRAEDRDPRYDYLRIRERLDMLRHARETNDDHELLFALNEGIHGNIGGIANPGLYNRAAFGTKDLITDYITEVTLALEHLAEVPDKIIPFEERIDFFRRASHCYGRSALMLSGAGSRTPFHLGVIRALQAEDLLPHIISGSSGGAIVAAVVGTCAPEELDDRLDYERIIEGLKPISKQPSRKRILPNALPQERLIETIETLIPDLTFEEAFELSHKQINISVASSEAHRKSRLLNVITTPHVFVREAVLASCAVPGVFPPVKLAAKHYDGTRKPYLPEMEWIDGSVTDDLPSRRLGRLYGVNHFIASQTNPAVLWGVQDTSRTGSAMRVTRDWVDDVVKANLRASRPFVRQLTRNLPGLDFMSHVFFSVALQRYTADVNIIPTKRLLDPRKFLAELTEKKTLELIDDGMRVTWPKIEIIRNSTMISRCIDQILDDYEHDMESRHYIQRVPGPANTSRIAAAKRRTSQRIKRDARSTVSA